MFPHNEWKNYVKFLRGCVDFYYEIVQDFWLSSDFPQSDKSKEKIIMIPHAPIALLFTFPYTGSLFVKTQFKYLN